MSVYRWARSQINEPVSNQSARSKCWRIKPRNDAKNEVGVESNVWVLPPPPQKKKPVSWGFIPCFLHPCDEKVVSKDRHIDVRLGLDAIWPCVMFSAAQFWYKLRTIHLNFLFIWVSNAWTRLVQPPGTNTTKTPRARRQDGHMDLWLFPKVHS